MEIKRAKTCLQHEYCSECPLRADCQDRVLFYNKDQFFKELERSADFTSAILIDTGFSAEVVALSQFIFFQIMIKKRDRELQDHPIYSHS